MIRRSVWILSLVLVLATAAVAARSTAQQPAPKTPSGWILPPDAADTKNPLPVDAKLLTTGKGVFKDNCQKCHGPGGLGDGPDADPDAAEDMDLTKASRAEKNADGIVFYKVWNGRKKPKMTAQKDNLTKDQVWAVVAYVQTLRKKT